MNNKIRRNDPCPCNSGQKYKNCCQSLPQERPSPPSASSKALLGKALQEGWTYFQHNRLTDAEAICQKILHTSPKQADALHLSGIVALQNGDLDKAISLISKAIQQSATNPEYSNNLGFALHEQGKLTDAIRHYRKAISLQANYANAHYNLHALLINADDMQPAIESLKKVVELQPVDMDARFTLGVLLDYCGEVEAARQQFEIVKKGSALFRARLDAWEYLVSKNCRSLPITGSMINTFKLAVNAANPEGWVLEFGVRFGNSIRQIAALVDSKQTVHGFDSFEGLPEVWHHEPKGSYTTKGKIPSVPTNVKLHAGWFEETLPVFLAAHNGPVRLINIDCDIYSSTKTVLDLLASRIISGTVLIFDEYIGNEHWREDEFKAFQEAVVHNGWEYEYLCFSIFTKQVVVKIK